MWSSSDTKVMVSYNDIKYYIPADEKSRNWEDWVEFINDKGGEMLTYNEIKQIIEDNDNQPYFMNKDIWIPCWNDDDKTIRDWASLGEKGIAYKHFGYSHVDKFGYPDWGDLTD